MYYLSDKDGNKADVIFDGSGPNVRFSRRGYVFFQTREEGEDYLRMLTSMMEG